MYRTRISVSQVQKLVEVPQVEFVDHHVQVPVQKQRPSLLFLSLSLSLFLSLSLSLSFCLSSLSPSLSLSFSLHLSLSLSLSLDTFFRAATETMLAETMLADLRARAARICRCKCTGFTTRKVPLRNMTVYS